MRYNALSLVNQILNALDLQPVSTLGETEDSEQVLSILDRTVTELETDLAWYPNRTMDQPSTASGVSTDWRNDYPNIPWAMAIPNGVEAVYRVYYNNKLLRPLKTDDFIHRVERGAAFKSTGDPSYWTMNFKDDDYIIFDNFDSDTETKLTSSNCDIQVLKYDTTSIASDTSDVRLSDMYFACLLHRCLMYGFSELQKDRQNASVYERHYLTAKTKLNKNTKRFKRYDPSLGNFDFSRKHRNGIWINSSQYNDVSSTL